VRLLAALSLAFALTACAGARVGADAEHAAGVQPTPDWLPPYSPAQQALLEPGSDPVTVRARRTFPDTGVFFYASDHVLEDPRDAMRVTRMVAEIVERSPRFYAITDTKSDMANFVAQYGPPGTDEPNAWMLAHKDEHGEVHLTHAPLATDAREAYTRGNTALREGRAADATASFRAAVAKSPKVPALRLALAKSLERSSPNQAEQVYRELLVLDPTLSSAHVGLAGVQVARGDAAGARTSLAHALAYHPRSRTALAMAERLATKATDRVSPFAIFLDVDPAGAVRIGSAPTTASRMYAGCRAIMRYEPELRELLFDAAPSDPYFLSAAEEILCIESAIGAYVAERVASKDEGKTPPEDEQTQGMLGIARNDGLLGYVMFEILGKHRPEHARTAPAPVHRATFEYVSKHVLGDEPDPERELYFAGR
jgi:tetratricopeptide (TPR) repeat protein